MSDSDLNNISNDKITGEFCNERNSTEPDNLQGGMGDIFVKLSLIGKEVDTVGHDVLKNIYGEPLKKCQKYPDDSRGLWDSDGFCSEKGGGVIKYVLMLQKILVNFSVETGQSEWSKDRIGKNHCMCLGAWSLYKAKQNNELIQETNNELNCEAIPEMSLSDNYINNWNTWNGNELEDQVVDGVNSLMKQCYNKGNYSQKEYLKNKYNELTRSREEFHTTDIYNNFKI